MLLHITIAFYTFICFKNIIQFFIVNTECSQLLIIGYSRRIIKVPDTIPRRKKKERKLDSF